MGALVFVPRPRYHIEVGSREEVWSQSNVVVEQFEWSFSARFAQLEDAEGAAIRIAERERYVRVVDAEGPSTERSITERVGLAIRGYFGVEDSAHFEDVGASWWVPVDGLGFDLAALVGAVLEGVSDGDR